MREEVVGKPASTGSRVAGFLVGAAAGALLGGLSLFLYHEHPHVAIAVLATVLVFERSGRARSLARRVSYATLPGLGTRRARAERWIAESLVTRGAMLTGALAAFVCWYALEWG